MSWWRPKTARWCKKSRTQPPAQPATHHRHHQPHSLVQKNLQAKSWLERGTQTERNLNEQVQMLKGNLLLSRILYQLYQQLEAAPSIAVKNLEEQIADLHLAPVRTEPAT